MKSIAAIQVPEAAGYQKYSKTHWWLHALLALWLLVLAAWPAQAQNINTVAGGGVSNSNNIPATTAALSDPAGVGLDGAGNLYITNVGNGHIHKVDASTGLIRSLTQLNVPTAVAADSAGNLYIAEFGASRVRKVAAVTGVLSIVAGTGVAGFNGDGIAATGAALNSPHAVALDAAGNLYIADTYSHRIRKVDASTGLISTVAGNGTVGFSGDGAAATAAQLNTPLGLAVDGADNLYISDYGNNRVRKVNAQTGRISTIATVAASWPVGVAVDGVGNVYFADSGYSVVRKVNILGQVSIVAGISGSTGFSGDGAAATGARLTGPNGVAVDSAGNLYIGDFGNNRVRKVNTAVPPGAPTGATAAEGDAQATVNWTAPASPGTAPITSYTATAVEDASKSCTATGAPPATSCTVAGLTNGAAYTFTVTATSAAGTSGPSAASSPAVTPQGMQTISFTNPGNQNFGTTPTLTASASSGQPVTFTASGVCSVTGTTLSFSATGSCTVNAAQVGNAAYAAAPTVTHSFTVNAVAPGAPTGVGATAGNAQATVSWIAPAANGGSLVTGYIVTASGGGTCSAVAPTTTCTVLGLTNGTAYTFTVTATNAASLISVPSAASSPAVTPQGTQTITFANPGLQAFGTTPTLTASASSGQPVIFTASGVCSVTGTTLSFSATGSCTVNAAQAGNAAYAAAPTVSHSFTVGKGTQTITFPAQPGQTFAPSGSFAIAAASINSGLTITYGTTTPSVCTVNTTTVTMLSASTCTLTADQAGDANWNPASQATQTVTIDKAAQTISFPAQTSHAFSLNGAFTLSPGATASSNLTVTYGGGTSGVCTVSSTGVVTMLGAGTCALTANQAGDANWNPASQATQTVTIDKAAQTISFPAQTSHAFSLNGTFTLSPGATASSNLTVTYGGGTSGVCTVSSTGVVTMLGAGACALTADQAGDANWNAATQAMQNVTIGKGINTISFPAQGGQTFSVGGTFAISSVATGKSTATVTYGGGTAGVCSVSATGTVTMQGAGTCALTADQAGDANWNAAMQATQTVAIGVAVPGAPTGVAATAGNAKATVTWVAPTATGGSPITGYTVTAVQDSSKTCTPTPATTLSCEVMGLTNGMAYTFTVAVSNGTQTATSAPSNAVTPLGTTFSLPSPTGTGTVSGVVAGGGCGFEGVQLQTAASAGAPATRSFPHGVLGLVLANCALGTAATVTVTYPSALPVGAQYWKNLGGTWAPFAGAVLGANTATLTLVDGGSGDDDGAQNGRIVDPGAVSVIVAAGDPAPVPTLSQWMLVVLATLMGLLVWRRRAWL